MSSKDEERYYVETLAAAVPELAAAELKESEAPDFLIETRSGIIGVEVTELDDPPTPGMPRAMEQAGLRDWILSQARTRYGRAGGAPLHVSVLFTDYPPLTKQRSRTLAQELAEFLASSSGNFISYSQSRFWDDVTSEHFPEIASISAVRVPDESYSSWSTGAGGWVRHASAVEVQRIVSRKEARLPTYRLRCTHAWLLIAFDLFAAGDAIHAPTELVDFAVQTDFDRVFCLNVVNRRVSEIPRESSDFELRSFDIRCWYEVRDGSRKLALIWYECSNIGAV